MRDNWKTSRGPWLGAAIGLGALAAILTVNWQHHRELEREQGWVNAAPPCPTITAAAYTARGYRAHERTTDYDGAVFARQFGHLICKDVDTVGGWGFVTHPVCQFTSPTAIRVGRGETQAYFELGPGQQATVSLDGRTATCVLSGKYSLSFDPTN